METDRKECPLEVVQCEYQNVECGEKVTRNRKKQHEHQQMEEHLSLIRRRLTNTQQELADTKSRLVELMNAVMVTQHQTTGQTAPRSAALSYAPAV